VVSVGIDKTLSIAANMIPVLWKYNHNMVLTVFCLSGIVSVLIVNFHKKLWCVVC